MKNISTDNMSAYEYLEYLQLKMYGSQVPPFAADVGEVLTANLIASLPIQHRQHLSQTVIGVLPSKNINAWTTKVPSGGEIIGFDFGTMSFLLALNKILLCRVNMLGFEQTLDFEEAAKRAAAVVKSFYGKGEFPRWQVSPRKMLLASALSNVQIAFIVGHELGHILLGHLETPHNNNNIPMEVSHAREFGADDRGGELAFATFKKSYDTVVSDVDNALAQAGPDLFFTYMIFMYKVLGLPADSTTGTHPTSEARRAKLRERFAQGMPEQARALASMGEKIFKGFAEILDSSEDFAQETPISTKKVSTAKQSKTPKKPVSQKKKHNNINASSKQPKGKTN